jgi:hypothetical protein
MQMPTNNLLRFPPDSSAAVMHERYSRTWWWQIAYLSNLLCVSARFQPPLSPCPTSHCFVDGFFVRKSHVTQAVQAMKKPNLAAIRSIRTTTYTLANREYFPADVIFQQHGRRERIRTAQRMKTHRPATGDAVPAASSCRLTTTIVDGLGLNVQRRAFGYLPSLPICWVKRETLRLAVLL